MDTSDLIDGVPTSMDTLHTSGSILRLTSSSGPSSGLTLGPSSGLTSSLTLGPSSSLTSGKKRL